MAAPATGRFRGGWPAVADRGGRESVGFRQLSARGAGSMNKFLLLAFGCLLSLILPVHASGVSDFALIDHQGKFHQLSRYADREAVVLYMHSSQCATSKATLPKFLSLQEKMAGEPVEFMVMMADSGQTRSNVAAMAQRRGINLPILFDESQLITRELGFNVASEVVVIDPERMEVLYRGAVDGNGANASLAAAVPPSVAPRSTHLERVLFSILEGRPLLTPGPPADGMSLALDRLQSLKEREISYTDDVVPILKRRCTGCHQENGTAPWAMSSHRVVKGWSAMIRETLLTRRMPPGQIDPRHVDRFADVHHITSREKATLVEWIENGALRDGEEDPLAEQEPAGPEWALGEPDLVVEFPEQNVPAKGVIDYIFTPVEIDIDEDKWVSAYEFNIGNRAALHHVVAYTQNERQQRQNSSRGGSRTNFGGYAPGRQHVVFDDNTGILLKKDMRFMIQFHYTTIGREVTDQTSLGLYFRDTPPERNLSRTAVMNGEFVIPPGARNHRVTATTTIPRDSWLYSFAPHMHYRGRDIRFFALYPDGGSEELLSIPNFQHNWQMVYRLREPVHLPAGTVVVADGGYDNSALNPLNPDPSQEVTWGDQVWDEMFITWMRISEVE